MRFSYKIAFFLLLLLAGNLTQAQIDARLMLNNNPFVVMDNGIKLVLGNENSNGVTQTNGGGMIVSEGEDNELIWHINEQTGQTYTVPFGTTPVSQGGNGAKIPLSLEVSTGGTQSTSGSISFSTWEDVTDDFSNLPTGVTNASDGLRAVDRFWGVYPGSYSTNPEVELSFTYDDNASEIGGSNLLVESSLVAQNYNTTTDIWLSTSGVVDASANVVSGVSLNSTQFSSELGLWVLVDASYPLPIELLSFEARCYDFSTELVWMTASEINNDYFVLEKSNDVINFSEVAKVDGTGNSSVLMTYSFVDEVKNHQTTYYRLKQVDYNGDFSYSKIVAIAPCSENLSIAVYPNPFKEDIYLKLSEEQDELYFVQLTDIYGRVVQEKKVYSNNTVNKLTIDDSNVSGVYIILIKDQLNHVLLNQKLVKLK